MVTNMIRFLPSSLHFMRTLHCISFMLFISFSSLSLAQKGRPKGPTDVIVATVVQGHFADQIEALGTTKANESVVITSDRPEKITALHFEDGQKVKQGQLLVSLDKTQEEAELRASKALTVLSQSSYNRAKDLSGSSALPKATLQERYTELKQAQAATDALKASLESYEIKAPFDGILGFRDMSVGTLVQPGHMITTLNDISQIKVDFAVPSLFLQALKPGMQITGHVDAYGDREFKGIVKTVNTQIDPITRTVKVRAIIPNQDELLKPGLLMNVLLSQESRPALLIPEEALIKRSDKNFVFVISQNDKTMIAQQTQITLGSRKPGTIEILSGLSEGDTVVIHGTVKIKDGAEVSIRAVEGQETTLEDLLNQKKKSAVKTQKEPSQ